MLFLSQAVAPIHRHGIEAGSAFRRWKIRARIRCARSQAMFVYFVGSQAEIGRGNPIRHEAIPRTYGDALGKSWLSGNTLRVPNGYLRSKYGTPPPLLFAPPCGRRCQARRGIGRVILKRGCEEKKYVFMYVCSLFVAEICLPRRRYGRTKRGKKGKGGRQTRRDIKRG